MFERPGSGHRAVLVGLDVGEASHADSVEELKQLAQSAGVAPLAVIGGRRPRPDPAYFAGRGKVEEVERAITACGADVVIFNHDLAHAPQRPYRPPIRRRRSSYAWISATTPMTRRSPKWCASSTARACCATRS
jgi:GTP-binding protein HflX